MERSGNEWRWKRHGSVTFRGNRWYRHSQQMGSHAIDFMQEFFGMSYPEAVTYLLNGETGQTIHGGSPPRETVGKRAARPREEETTEEKEPKVLVPPEKNDTMKRVYAYLMQKRHISREVLSFFARQGILYESAGHHNAVFVGVDKEGNPRHIHKKGTCSDGRSFRMNEDGSDSSYGFGYAGVGNKLYVFEAPIDFLSFLTLYPKNWQENSYIVLNGVSEHAMLQMLKDYSNLDTVVLCLDHDPAGIEACGRLAEILVQNGYRQIKNLKSSCKDWNEDLKLLHGEEVIPAQEHPKILECRLKVFDALADGRKNLQELEDVIQVKGQLLIRILRPLVAYKILSFDENEDYALESAGRMLISYEEDSLWTYILFCGKESMQIWENIYPAMLQNCAPKDFLAETEIFETQKKDEKKFELFDGMMKRVSKSVELASFFEKYGNQDKACTG